jgi:hypothetical protein
MFEAAGRASGRPFARNLRAFRPVAQNLAMKG